MLNSQKNEVAEFIHLRGVINHMHQEETPVINDHEGS